MRHVRWPRCGRGDLREKDNDPDLHLGAAHDHGARDAGTFGRNGTFGEGAERRDCPQEALESELLAKMETLKNVHESWMLDQDVAARRTTGVWTDHRSPPHVQGSRLQCVSTAGRCPSTLVASLHPVSTIKGSRIRATSQPSRTRRRRSM